MTKALNEAKILVVDDDPDLRVTVAMDFELQGCEVKTASNGVEAQEVMSSERIDVVLSDIRMPGGDGIGFLETVKGKNPFEPIVILFTGYADLEIETAYEKGADGLFPKPYHRKSLLEKVKKEIQEVPERWSVCSEIVTALPQVKIEASSLEDGLNQSSLLVGRGGLFARIIPSNLHRDVEVSFVMTSRSLFGTGIVRWTTKDKGYGIEFTSMSNALLKEAVATIERLKPTAFIPKG